MSGNHEQSQHSQLLATRARWDKRFLEICETVSRWSSCKSRKIGAIIVRDKTIVSTGYNGPPRGVPHCGQAESVIAHFGCSTYGHDPKICPRKAMGYNSGEGLHLCPAAHAETNAIVNAARLGVTTMETTIYMNCGIPCRECMKLIINSGIKEIVCTNVDDLYDNLSVYLVKASGITVRAFSKGVLNV